MSSPTPFWPADAASNGYNIDRDAANRMAARFEMASTAYFGLYLIAILVAPHARRFIRVARRLATDNRNALDRLPAASWALGLVIGVWGAGIIAPLAYGLPRLAQLR